MYILVLNSGSSSLKFSLLYEDRDGTRVAGKIAWSGRASAFELQYEDGKSESSPVEIDSHAAATRTILVRLKEFESEIRIVGHRVVHGGERFKQSVIITDAVRAAIRELSSLAPLHNPPALESIEAAQTELPNLPHVAVFDTSYYATLPPEAFVYPLPYEWYKDWGVRRYGFHGISHAWCVGQAAKLQRTADPSPRRAETAPPVGPLPQGEREMHAPRVISCHLGNGCSVTASIGGVAHATSMGFTPLDGVMMGTRPGSLDPGILEFVLREKGISPTELDTILNHRSGLLGVSGVSEDYRKVAAAATQGHERAILALKMYSNSIRAAVGAMAVKMNGLDTLIFTGGVGENAAPVRAEVCEGLQCLGVQLDASLNANCKPDAEIHAAGSRVPVLVLRAQEDVMIRNECLKLT